MTARWLAEVDRLLAEGDRSSAWIILDALAYGERYRTRGEAR